MMVELFSDKHVIHHVKDNRIVKFQGALQFFRNWKQNASSPEEFISDKTWFDLQSMVLGFISMINTKLSRLPGSVIKPAIVNQDIVENHFSQLQPERKPHIPNHPSHSKLCHSWTISRKCNTGTAKNNSFAGLPKEKLFRRPSKKIKD